MLLSDDLRAALRQHSKDEHAYQQIVTLLQNTSRTPPPDVLIQDQESALRAILDNSEQTFTLLDNNARLIAANKLAFQRAAVLFGKLPRPGDSFYEFVLPAYLDSFNHRFQRALKGETVIVPMEVDYQPGVTTSLELRFQPVRNEDEAIIGVCLVETDISNYVRLQAVARRKSTEFEMILNTMPDAVLFTNQERRIIIINPAFTRLFGYTAPEIIGESTKVMYANEADYFRQGETLFENEALEVPLPYEYLFRRKDGSEFLSETIVSTVHDENDQVMGFMGVVRDITERKQAQERALDLALQQERMQILSTFIRDASHEFRTPLSVINSSLYLLEKTADPERRTQRIGVIQKQVADIVNLVDAMSTMTRLDSSPDFHFVRFSVNELIETVVQTRHNAVRQRHHTLKLELADGLPHLRGDTESLTVVLVNILDNAIRYTPEEGFIRITTGLEDAWLVIGIQDNGPGINDEALPHIFEHFFRTDRARSQSGFGLGLTIALKIVQLHGGTIEVESVLNHGAIFRILLPLQRRPDRGM